MEWIQLQHWRIRLDQVAAYGWHNDGLTVGHQWLRVIVATVSPKEIAIFDESGELFAKLHAAMGGE